MLPYVTDHFGNPSSGHTYGVTCRSAVDKARAQVAALVGAQPEEIVFTGCGTGERRHTTTRRSARSSSRAAAPPTRRPPLPPAAAESDNWVVYGAVMGARASWGTGSARVPHVVASNIEHPAILAHLKHMEQLVGAGPRQPASVLLPQPAAASCACLRGHHQSSACRVSRPLHRVC